MSPGTTDRPVLVEVSLRRGLPETQIELLL
jgi:hypothetical protein